MKSPLTETAVQNKFTIILFLLFISTSGFGQTIPMLERSVTLELADESVEKALKKIAKEAKLTFSYTSSDLDLDQNISASFKSKTVREVLEQIFKGTVSFKEKGKYIILIKVPAAAPKTSAVQPKNPLFINGYILNAATGEKISGVSIYDTRTLTAAVSNNFGYFSMILKDPQEKNELTVSRKNYNDTAMIVKEDTYAFLNISLTPEIKPEISSTIIYDTISRIERITDTIFVASAPAALPQDTTVVEPDWSSDEDTLHYKKVQFSVVPFAGTNGQYSNVTVNDFSFNLVGGYSAGTRALELASVFNINRGDVSYLQLAGHMNFNEGRMRGFQAAGIFNTNLKGLKGFQMAGIANVNKGRSDGMQLGGIVNIQNGRFRGVQLAGITNISKRRMKGVQIAPVVNYASNLKGVQIGLINIADTLHGVPIGFISFVRRGYHKLEFSADEIFYANVAFRTGTYAFYNVFNLGIKPETDPNDEDRSTEWTFGYGVGTASYIFNWLLFNFDITANHLNKGEFNKDLNLLNKAYAGLEFQPFDRIGVAVGVTLNGHLTKNSAESQDIFTDYQPEIIKEHTYSNGTNLKMWVGYKVAIRFF